MVGRDYILSEIARTAAEHGGVPLGERAFRTETGIRPTDWLRYWPRWGDALRDAGLPPNERNVARAEGDVLARLMVETRRLGRWPTTRELNLLHRKDPSVPSQGVFRRLGGRRILISKLAEYCRAEGAADVLALLEPLLEESAEEHGDGALPADKEQNFGSVYLLKWGRNYKLGRTNALGRRERELAIQLPERVTRVHEIKTDDPAGIEAYWHRRFAERRTHGEWFELTARDVSAFRRRKFM